MLSLSAFYNRFNTHTKDWTWQVQGFIDQNNNIYPIDSDTKVISTVFERFSSPVIRTIAQEFGYCVNIANQTTYPDFTLSKYDENGQLVDRIAIDIKTTYCDQNRGMVFTLGSYKSFIRNNTKNILYPYNTYNSHWVLGFIYSRNDAFQEYNLNNLPRMGQIPCPYTLRTIFLREKVCIVGLRAGSGNTANIGSVKLRNPDDFITINGPFTQFRDQHGAMDLYWSNYDNYKLAIHDYASLFNHPDFNQFK